MKKIRTSLKGVPKVRLTNSRSQAWRPAGRGPITVAWTFATVTVTRPSPRLHSLDLRHDYRRRGSHRRVEWPASGRTRRPSPELVRSRRLGSSFLQRTFNGSQLGVSLFVTNVRLYRHVRHDLCARCGGYSLPDTMDVEVDNMGYMRDINSTGRNIGCNKNVDPSSTELA